MTAQIYFDRDGRPIGRLEWQRLFEHKEYRSVDETILPGGVWVSTVWIGLDHSLGGDVPQIFESMVFETENSSAEIDCRRYSSLEEARKGHAELCRAWGEK